ncbi:MAG: hypothetical protein QOG67_636 [Verrucomicrobiota bacterium]
MFETEFPRVQHLSRENFAGLRSVNLIAKDGMPDVMKVDSDLMRPAAVQPALDQTGRGPVAKDAVFCFGAAASN